MDKTAKPDDATSPEAFPKADPKLNPRNQAFAEIAKEANERSDASAAEPMPPRDGEAPPVDEELTLEEGAAQANAAAEAATEEAPAAPAGSASVDPNAEYDVTVDGMKLKVKGQKIIDAGYRTFQKETAADYRLQLATKMLEDAKKTVSAVPEAKPPVQGAPQPEQQIDPMQLAELIQFGTKEQAAEAIKLLQKRDSSTLTQEGLQQFMVQQIPQMVNQQLSFRER